MHPNFLGFREQWKECWIVSIMQQKLNCLLKNALQFNHGQMNYSLYYKFMLLWTDIERTTVNKFKKLTLCSTWYPLHHAYAWLPAEVSIAYKKLIRPRSFETVKQLNMFLSFSRLWRNSQCWMNLLICLRTLITFARFFVVLCVSVHNSSWEH